tara:strand:+ start:140 stop:1033 length:894 start_codon:yes stop_codon:yes gene_type:complete
MTVKIDCHLHVFAKPSDEFPREVSASCPEDREETAERLLGEMEANNIDQAILTQMGGAEFEHHNYVRHCVDTYPDRFQGIGLIPGNCENPAEHMDRVAGDGQFIGFRLGSLGGPRDPLTPMDVRDYETYRIWEHAAERDYVMWLYLKHIDIYAAAYLIEAFPQVRVVFNHLGVSPGDGTFSWDKYRRPHVTNPNLYFLMHSVYRLSRYENVSMMFSGHYAFSDEEWPWRDFAQNAQWLVEAFRGRLMWASDFPWIYVEPGYDKMVGLLKELVPNVSDEDHASIMGGAAKRILRFADR